MIKFHDRKWSICNVLLVGIAITSIFFSTPAFSQEQIASFEKKDLPVLNDELKRLVSDIEVAFARLPAGAMTIWPTDTEPAGWVLCDGSAYNASLESKYQPLYDVIGNDFGGSDNTDFTVPDLRGRVPLGQDNMGGTSANRVTDTDADTVGNADGEENHTLTGAESGTSAHNHTVPSRDNSSTGTVDRAINADNDSTQLATITTSTSSEADASSAHNNMQPYITLTYIIKL